MNRISILVVCWAVRVFAAPSVTQVSPTSLTDGETIAVTGSSFGAANGTIVSWDDFSSRATGSVIGASPVIGPQWSLQSGGAVTYSSAHAHSGSTAAMVDWSGTSGIAAFGWTNQGPFTRIYISYWRWMEGDYSSDMTLCQTPDGYACNHKQFYLFGNQGQHPQAMPLIPGGSETWGFYNNDGHASSTLYNSARWNWSNTSRVWNRWEFWLVLNSPTSSANGVVQMWVDGTRGVNVSNYSWPAGQWVDFRLGHMARGFTSSARAWFDDLYVASTIARVELCNVADWANCTHREVQPFSSWSDASISVRVNQGSFASGDTAYLFVIDANGEVSSGSPVTFGARTCTDGAVCVSSDGCKTGVVTCSSGASVCTNLSNQPEGTSCSVGSCVAGVCTRGDAGTSVTDSGIADAGQPSADASTPLDAGEVDGGDVSHVCGNGTHWDGAQCVVDAHMDNRGCGCATSDGQWALFALLLFALGVRRMRSEAV